MFSLKQRISKILIITIGILSLVLLILLSTMVGTYQKNQSTGRLEELATYAETLSESILQLNNATGAIYSSNKTFEALSVAQTSVSKYIRAYDILNMLQIQVKSNKNLSGLFTYYDNAKEVVYFVGEDVSFSEKEVLKKQGKIVAEGSKHNYTGVIVEADEEVYYNVFLKKALATIMGTINLSSGLPLIPEKSATYGVIYENIFYQTVGGNHDLTKEECADLQPGRNRVGYKIVYLQKLGVAEMAVVEVVPISPWLYFNGVHMVLAVLIIILIYSFYRVYQFIYVEISRPLEDMTTALQRIQTGVWEVEFEAPNRITEIENVRDTVRLMLNEIEAYKIRNYEERLEKQKTQLQYLQLQLAPHFYTNCLKNAYYMLMLKEYKNAEQFLLCLSTHLRYLLQRDGTRITVETEGEFVENYLNLQKLMMDVPIFYEIEIEKKVLKIEVPILIIQTFVENAVKYSLKQGGEGLRVQIKVQYRTTEQQKYLDIMVRDNGHGYPTEVLAMLNQKNSSEQERLGVGIINLLSRIRLSYGEEAKWYFKNESGACSELWLPLEKEDEL